MTLGVVGKAWAQLPAVSTAMPGSASTASASGWPITRLPRAKEQVGSRENRVEVGNVGRASASKRQFSTQMIRLLSIHTSESLIWLYDLIQVGE